MVRRLGRLLLVVVLAGAVWSSSVVPARAELPPIWWLPPAWVEVVAGVAEVGVNVLTGQADQSPVSGGADPFDVGVAGQPAAKGSTIWRAEYAGLDARGLPRVRYVYDGCLAGINGTANCPYGMVIGATQRWVALTFADGFVQTAGELLRDEAAYVAGVSAEYAIGTIAAGHGSVVRADYPGDSGSAQILEPFVWVGTAELATTTTALTCRGSEGDFTVSETSAPGSAVAPSPVCPAGSMPVRITVTNSVDGVLSDTSVTAPDWYLSSPGTVDFEMGIGPNRCIAGMPECDLVRSDPDQYWNDTTHTCWAKQRDLEPLMAINASYSGDAGDWVQVPDELCKDPNNPSGVAPMPTPPETPTDPDQGIIARGLERLKEAVDGVKRAVQAGTAEAVRQGGLTRDAVRAAGQAAADAAAAGADRVAEAVADAAAGAAADAAATRDAIGRAVTPDAGVMGGLAGRARDAFGAPFEEWTDALAAVPAAFNVASEGCQGPAWTIPGGGTHYPFQSCSGPPATVRGLVYVATGAGVVLLGLLACVRILAASIGLELGGGTSS